MLDEAAAPAVSLVPCYQGRDSKLGPATSSQEIRVTEDES